MLIPLMMAGRIMLSLFWEIPGRQDWPPCGVFVRQQMPNINIASVVKSAHRWRVKEHGFPFLGGFASPFCQAQTEVVVASTLGGAFSSCDAYN